jgi:hypothetical protein
MYGRMHCCSGDFYTGARDDDSVFALGQLKYTTSLVPSAWNSIPFFAASGWKMPVGQQDGFVSALPEGSGHFDERKHVPPWIRSTKG